ncbi:hypothetical protein pb186bvf_020510 [Paramecium bursaria]
MRIIILNSFNKQWIHSLQLKIYPTNCIINSKQLIILLELLLHQSLKIQGEKLLDLFNHQSPVSLKVQISM